VYSSAKSTQYPMSCPSCERNTATLAQELLNHKKLQCRHCEAIISLNENQMNSLKRTLHDLDICLTRPQAECS